MTSIKDESEKTNDDSKIFVSPKKGDMICGASALPPAPCTYFRGSGESMNGPGVLFTNEGAHRCTREPGHDGYHTKISRGDPIGQFIDDDGTMKQQIWAELCYWRDEHELIIRPIIETVAYKPLSDAGPFRLMSTSAASGSGSTKAKARTSTP